VDTNIKMEVVVLVQVMKVLFKHQFSSILLCRADYCKCNNKKQKLMNDKKYQ